MRTERQSGFSLIEILVVITIIGLLMGMGAVAVGKYRETGRISDCESRIQAIGLLAESYAERMGDYPPSRLSEAGVKDAVNEVNQGIEALVAVLRHKSYAGLRPDEKWIGNVDEDTSAQLSAMDGSNALLEVLDPWDNPFVYLVQSDYERPTVVRLSDGALEEDVEVRAATNPLTGAFHRYESYQIRSAGPDGLLDTEDDLANFEISSSGL
jgi:prepilin-type N-terminal cleavage/methylation domain-containing protein